MQTMKHDLFYEILDLMDISIKFFENKRKVLIGCAIHEDGVEERQKHLREAEQYKAWQDEAERTRQEFIDTYAPIDE